MKPHDTLLDSYLDFQKLSEKYYTINFGDFLFGYIQHGKFGHVDGEVWELHISSANKIKYFYFTDLEKAIKKAKELCVSFFPKKLKQDFQKYS